MVVVGKLWATAHLLAVWHFSLGRASSKAYARGVGGFGVKKKPLTFYKNFITCVKEINCFRIGYFCLLFVDLMQILRNELACKLQRTF